MKIQTPVPKNMICSFKSVHSSPTDWSVSPPVTRKYKWDYCFNLHCCNTASGHLQPFFSCHILYVTIIALHSVCLYFQHFSCNDFGGCLPATQNRIVQLCFCFYLILNLFSVTGHFIANDSIEYAGYYSNTTQPILRQ